MKVLYTFLFLLIVIISCRKEIDPYHQTTPTAQNIDTYDEAAEELQYQLDETDDEENQYEPEAIVMKVQSMFSADSLPYYASTDPAITKKQKYGRRQIINDTGTTTVKLYGYGFKPQTADSKILCRIKNDTVGYATITSWNDSAITCQIPTLLPLYNNKFFSLKFKVFRQNDNPLKLPVSRSKSRGCISRTLAVTARSQSTGGGNSGGSGARSALSDAQIETFVLNYKQQNNLTNQTRYTISENYIPQKHDILKSLSGANSGNIEVTEAIITKAPTNGTFEMWYGNGFTALSRYYPCNLSTFVIDQNSNTLTYTYNIRILDASEDAQGNPAPANYTIYATYYYR